MIINIGKEFYHRLANRDEHQGDGKNTAVQFRAKYLSFLDNQTEWKSKGEAITFDFSEVRKIGPSFANEAFAYFTKYATPMQILEKIKFINISRIQLLIIRQEIETGYRGKFWSQHIEFNKRQK